METILKKYGVYTAGYFSDGQPVEGFEYNFHKKC